MYTRKSQLLGFTLTLLFGPLGLLYASVAWGLALSVIALILGVFTFGVGALLFWPLSILLSFFIIDSANSRRAAEAEATAAYIQYQHDLAVWQAQVIADASRGDAR